MATTPSFSSTASASSAAGGGILRERDRAGRHRRQLCRRPGGHRLLRGIRRVGGLLARVPLPAQGARALRHAARHWRQMSGDARCARGGSPRGSLPALHGAFLTQRAVKGSRDLEKGRGTHVEGDQRVGIARGMRKEGRGGGGRAGVDAARGGRGDGVRRILPRRLPTRNSCLSTGVVSGRTTGSSASTARSGGRGSSGPSRTATRPSCR